MRFEGSGAGMAQELIGILAALASAATWAAGALLLKPFAERLPAMALAFAKGVFSLIVLCALILLAQPAAPSWMTAAVLFSSGILGIGVADTLFFKALRALSSHSVVQLMLLGQVATIIMAVAFLGERLVWLQWGGLGLVILGVALVLLDPEPGAEEGEGRATARGVLFGLGSVLAMAFSVTLAKGALAETDALTATWWRMAGGVVSLFVSAPMFYLGAGNWLTPLVADWRLAICFCLIATLVALGGFFLSLVAMKWTPLAIANTLLSTEPLFVLLITFLVYHQIPSRRRLAGSLIGVVGVAVLSVRTLLN
ncbi:DMT family transporter [Caldichromatium japonicum]|uniref:DMT family transporter n=1 Tax=Caldichromatium japonicum TaxID=2699430 RepID=A0A6G7VB04_9GAMM|nr:DMT family transporter [Caldichromatium japonicum]QIK37253.1 DMT family transporter [Caldichromatium japonicum]